MNVLRIVILIVAAVAAVVAAVLVRGAMQNEAPAPEPVVQAPATVRVLAARAELRRGERITRDKIHWVDWPQDLVTSELITDRAEPNAVERFEGGVVREQISRGEPMREARVVLAAGGAGVMSAVLTAGYRAVAVPISPEAAAGGFILPNDRVDLLVTYSPNGSRLRSDILVENVRVLAIDQEYDDEDDRGSVVGETATLELTPQQARAVAVAIAEGEISLILRSVADTAGGPVAADGGADEDVGQRAVRLVRYGNETSVFVGGGQ
jgi:pilus assembly protein CpaB